ncbi:hypothetical protein PLICRDRAFT_279631 [Plicaturopsis crispa FD-325 SS-3]|nr:hypothetical protein PLICRDRAFT_279631 [Plicaturopsis crispa FD-325 SS-3]
MQEEHNTTPGDPESILHLPQHDEVAKRTLASATGRTVSISWLPNEILGEIFLYGPTEFGDKELPSQVTISHVCRHWRAAAIGMPMLWTRIHSGRTLYSKFPPSLLDVFLERSGSCLLHIDTWYEDDLSFYKLTPHVHRWATLVVRDVWCMMLRDWDKLYAPNLTHLELVHIDCEEDTERLFDQDWPLFTGGLPKLTSLVLSGKLLSACIFPMPLRSLETLHIIETPTIPVEDSEPWHIMTAALKAVLTDADSLKTLKITDCLTDFFSEPLNGVDSFIKLPRLTTFDFKPPYDGFNTDTHYLTSAMTICWMPSLQHVILRTVDAALIEHLTDFMLRFNTVPSVETLTLEETDLTEDLMRIFPNVSYVTLRQCWDLNVYLPLFSKTDEHSRPLWPRLQVLEIETHESLRTADFTPTVTTRLVGESLPLRFLILKSPESSLPAGDSVAWLRERVRLYLVKI